MKIAIPSRLVCLAFLVFATSCHPPSTDCGFFRDNLCFTRVSIYSIISNPEKHEDTLLVVYGFLGIDNNEVFLFPNQIAYDGSDAVSSIQLLHDDFSDIDYTELEKRAGSYVVVYGRFSSIYDAEFFGMRAGSIDLLGIPEYRGGRVMDETTRRVSRIARDAMRSESN